MLILNHFLVKLPTVCPIREFLYSAVFSVCQVLDLLELAVYEGKPHPRVGYHCYQFEPRLGILQVQDEGGGFLSYTLKQ